MWQSFHENLTPVIFSAPFMCLSAVAQVDLAKLALPACTKASSNALFFSPRVLKDAGVNPPFIFVANFGLLVGTGVLGPSQVTVPI